MKCGICGGGVRLYSGTLHGRPVTDWKHRDAPPGTAPHRPVLGTPVSQDVFDRLFRSKEEAQATVVKEEIGPPLVPPRPATDEELADSQSATQILKLLELHRWELVEPPAYFKTAAEVEHLVIKGSRRDLGCIVTWRRRPSRGSWELEFAMRVASGLTQQVGSEQLKQWIGQRDERCPDCGRSSVVHQEGECP